MRTIKFRGKRLSYGEWVFGYLIVTSKGTEILEDGVFLEVDPATVGQFIGRADKNEKDIYEGDLLAPMPNDCRPEYKGNWIVGFNECSYVAEPSDGKTRETWIPYWSERQVEIIGSIHDTPATDNGAN